MKDFPIRFVLTDEAITPSAGLALVGYLLHQTKRDKRVNDLRLPTVRRDVHISHSDVIRSMIGLLATGKTDVDHMEALLVFNCRHPSSSSTDLVPSACSHGCRKRCGSECVYVDFVIKRNLRRESKALWFQIASQKGRRVDDGQTEGVQTYELCFPQTAAIDGHTYTYVQITQATERTMERNGQLMLVPDDEVESYWVRLEGYEHVRMGDVLALYHDHATCEQFHSELKSDLDLERLPSGKMKTNTLVLVMGAFVYNLLRLIGQNLLSDPRHPLHHKVKRRRIKTIIQTVITMAG